MRFWSNECITKLDFQYNLLFLKGFHKCVKIAHSIGKPDFDWVWGGFARFTHRVIHRFCGQLKILNEIKAMLLNVNNFLNFLR